MKNKKILIVIILLMCAIGIAIFFKHDNPVTLSPDENASSWQGKQDLVKQKTDVKQIAIPGFDSLVFVAGQIEQKVNFYNPKENDCLIVFSLHIDDKELWRSGFCSPDHGYYEISLNEPLEMGTYKAQLLNQCFKPDGTPLNCANVDFTLTVQEN